MNNTIQDIILESEYNVLMALEGYYEKQYMLEYYTEAAGGAVASKPNILVRIIDWCKRALRALFAKFKRTKPETPIASEKQDLAESAVEVSEDLLSVEEELSETTDPNTINQLNQRVENDINKLNNAKNGTISHSTTQPSQNITVGDMQSAIKNMNDLTSSIEKDNANIQRMKDTMAANQAVAELINNMAKATSMGIQAMTESINASMPTPDSASTTGNFVVVSRLVDTARRTNKYCTFNSSTGRIEPTTDELAEFVQLGYKIYPNQTKPFKTDSVNRNVFVCDTREVYDDTIIIPALVDAEGNIKNKGKISSVKG